MAWNTPADWDFKETPGSAKLNAQIRDNLNYLKSMLPAGTVVETARSTAPDQWLLCDGSAVSRTTYADLFTAIGVTYGAGDGSSTFNLPNTKGKVVVGLNASETEFDALGETGGAKTHTLQITEIPSHDHGGSTGSSSVPGAIGAEVAGSGTSRDEINPGSHAHSIPAQGGGSAHNNLQPYITMNYIIKY